MRAQADCAPAPGLGGRGTSGAPSTFADRARRLGAALALAVAAVMSVEVQAGVILERVKARGGLRCGVGGTIPTFSRIDQEGEWRGLDVDYCRAVAAAVTGDGHRVTFVALSLQNRFVALQTGEVDLLARDTVVNLSRDTSLGVVFVGINFYTGAGFIVRRDSGITSTEQMNGATFCITQGNSALADLSDHMRARNFQYKLVQLEKFQDTFQAFLSGRCDAAIAGAADLAGAQMMMAPRPHDLVVLQQLLSRDPYGPAVARGDWEWFSIARWTLNGLIEAEEREIRQDNVRTLAEGSKDPNVRRMLGADDDLGRQLGLSRDWLVRVIEAVGNYGEIYDRHFGSKSPVNMPRGQNNLASHGGLLYSPPFR
jgi:general L-amino acid transport system substrate-binding protein